MLINIKKLVHGGSGMGEADGKKVFVPFSAPGDVLDVNITSDHGNFAEGEIVSIIKAAPCRIVPRCPVFGRCGGCQWQHLSYDEQLNWKRTILSETVERIGKISNTDIPPALPSPRQWNYRNRIQLHVDSMGHVGFYRPRSKEVVEFDECAIADERLNAELKTHRAEFSKRDRGIALRVEDKEEAFAQINTGQNEQMKKVVSEWLSKVPHKRILELHCGSGNFTFGLAALAEHVVASDIDGRAIKIAKEKQKKAGAGNIEFVCAPAARAGRRLHDGCDAVLMDPPRKGCAEAMEAVLELKPKTIIYISCDPATLARDASSLVNGGYRLEKLLPVDMFPQTFHIEAISMFSC